MKFQRSTISEQVVYHTSPGPQEKKYFLGGLGMQAETVNQNGRVYPRKVLEREVARYIDEYVSKNRAYGELGHPPTPIINPERISHMITEIIQDGNDFYCKAKIMGTPMGNIVKNIIDEGGKLGVSSRGIASLKEDYDGIKRIQDDFKLSTFSDIVVDPSVSDAFVDPIMEQKEWIYKNGIIKESQIHKYRKEIQRTNMNSLEKVGASLFSDFLKRLK